MEEYEVTTIGDLPVGWSPANDRSTGVVAGPPRPLANEESLSAPAIALVALGGVLFGALGLWALRKWT